MPLIILAMVAGLMIAKKYLRYVVPMYESTAKLKLADSNEGIPSSNLFKDLDVFATSNKIRAEIEVLKSTALLQNVLDSLDFDCEIYRVGSVRKTEVYDDSPIHIDYVLTADEAYDKPFQLSIQADSTYTITFPDGTLKKGITFGTSTTFKYGHVTITRNQNLSKSRPDIPVVGNYEFICLSRPVLLGKIAKYLDIVAVDKDVAVLQISFRSPSAKKAAEFVNQLTTNYVQDYIQTKHKAAHLTVDFLTDRIKSIAEKLTDSENEITRFRENRNIINLRQETETDLRKISEMKIQQTNVKMTLEAIEELNRYMEQEGKNYEQLAPNFEAFNDLLSTEIVKKIQQLQSERRDLLLTYTPENEQVQIIDLKIRDLAAYIKESITNTKNNLRIKYDRLSRDITEAEKAFVEIPEKEKILTILNREFEIYQGSYNFLNEKKIEAEIAQAAKIAFHRTITPAVPSKKPISPNHTIITIVAALLGMFGAFAFIFVVHELKGKVNDTHTLENNSTIHIAFTTPFLKSVQAVGTHFLNASIQLDLKGIFGNRGVLTVTSENSNEGNSFHVLNLAQAFAGHGFRVLVVDACLNLTHLGSSSNTTPANTEYTHIDYLPLNQESMQHLTRQTMKEYLSNLRQGYEIIIINSTLSPNEAKGLLLMNVADTNLLVVDSRRTSLKQIPNIEVLKQEYTIPNIWFVLNRAGYNPSLIKEGMQVLMKGIQFMKNKFRHSHV